MNIFIIRKFKDLKIGSHLEGPHNGLAPILRLARSLPKFNHLFAAIPVSKSTLQELNKIIYHYLWDGKPDKINRKTICKSYLEGGLKMINISNFEKSQKLKWLNNITCDKHKIWFEFLRKYLGDGKNFYVLGGKWCSTFLPNLNPFWRSVFTYWLEICRVWKPETNEDILQSCIWFNNCVSTNKLYFST